MGGRSEDVGDVVRDVPVCAAGDVHGREASEGSDKVSTSTGQWPRMPPTRPPTTPISPAPPPFPGSCDPGCDPGPDPGCDPAGADAGRDPAGADAGELAGEVLGDPLDDGTPAGLLVGDDVHSGNGLVVGDGVHSGNGLVVGDGAGVPAGAGTVPGTSAGPGTDAGPGMSASRTTRIGRSSGRSGRFSDTGAGVLCGRAMPTGGPVASPPPGTTTGSCGPPATNGVRGRVDSVSDADPASTAARVGTDARVTSSPTTIGYRRATPVERCRAIVRGSGADTQRLLRISGTRLDARAGNARTIRDRTLWGTASYIQRLKR
jgi:hypothetical protein